MHSFAASWFPHNRRWAGGLVGVADKRVPTEGSDFEPRREGLVPLATTLRVAIDAGPGYGAVSLSADALCACGQCF
jgi:hypothetical protein